MKKLCTLLLFGCCLLLWTDATAQQNRFDEANNLLESGKYSQAIEMYQSIRRDGNESGALWLNMGISYVQLDSLGMAKFSFIKAADFPETTEDAAMALEFVNDRFPRQSAVLPQLPWVRFMEFIRDSIGTVFLSLSALLFLYIGTFMLIGSWFRADINHVLRPASYSAFGITIFLFILISVITYRAERYDDAVVVNTSEAVYQQPKETSATISTAYEGYLMQVDYKESKTEEGWYYIRLENGMYGWIRKHALKIV